MPLPNSYASGFKDGLPIGLGYLSVSFSFGILAIVSGLNTFQSILVSLTNLTSAGQVAGVGIMSASGGLIEMGVTQLLINLRYSLMSVSLSQKADDSFTTPKRLLLSFAITDEIFGVAMNKDHRIGPKYFAGLITLPFIGWTLGTALGAICGNYFPDFLINALTIGIYAMFVAIVIPACKKSSKICIVCAVAVALSCLFKFVPFLSFVSSGFACIISAVVAAGVGTFLSREDKA